MAKLDAIEKDLETLLAQDAVELVDLRYLNEGGRWTLRAYVDKAGGVTLDDCEAVSHRVSAFLDASDVMTHSYVLEVSSPGLDRVIKKDKDFERFASQRVQVRLRTPVDGRRRHSGLLKGLEAGQVLIEAEAGLVRVDRAVVEEARLDPEIKV
ncbi:MAG: ribosome maturation factor RimP [Elusimicrobia bacterium]|nr:ribosome maturation factor RimP [Elusimicrobiota bacterium]